MKERYASFCQSTLDFPCSVELGKNTPSFGINRWGKYGLRFFPPDDEGFSVRGDKRQLLYKGRRRSHRFTVHSDTSFEYDCILLKEPDSNTVCLRMEGAENFDFFRQPDFVRDPFLKGSYAVYKKETLIGQGTGKLCHIHRPLIIDALGRRCWGVLAVAGNELRITIPENWLATAKYPVTVDPVVGTNTVGSQFEVGEYDDGWDEWIYYDLMIEMSVVVNRFYVNDKIDGNCTAYFYTNHDDKSGDCGGRAVIYSDNNVPKNRKSKQENLIDFSISASKPKGWRSGSFEVKEVINADSYIWFGCFSDYVWYPRFDYGEKCYKDYWYQDYDSIPDTYPVNRFNYFYDYKISMYFTYTANYTRTLTQSVKLTDNRNIKIDFKRNISQETKLTDIRNLQIDYKRISAQTTDISDNRNLKADYKREKTENVNNSTVVSAFISFFRNCFDSIGITDGVFRFPSFFCNLIDDVKINFTKNEQRELNRNCKDTTNISDVSKRSLGIFRNIFDNIENTDRFSFSVIFVRSVQDTQTISDIFKQVRNFIRCLKIEAANIAETERSGNFFRTENDTADADGSILRQLSIFIKLVSSCFVRDFIIRRFLIAREELVLKSCITREITLESKIN